MRHEHDMCIDLYSKTEQQIRADVILSRQLQEEEQVQLIKQSNQIEYNIPTNYYTNTMQFQCIPKQIYYYQIVVDLSKRIVDFNQKK